MRIDHVALYCRDLEGMRAFFLKYFDAFSNDKYHNPRTGLSTYILSFNEGSCRLELMNRPDMVEVDAAKNKYRIHPSLVQHWQQGEGGQENLRALASRLYGG